MTKFEKAVKLIAEAFKDDCIEYECSLREFFKIMCFDTEDFRDEFLNILYESDFNGYFTDECEIEDDDGKFKTLRQLITAVKKYEF